MSAPNPPAIRWSADVCCCSIWVTLSTTCCMTGCLGRAIKVHWQSERLPLKSSSGPAEASYSISITQPTELTSSEGNLSFNRSSALSIDVGVYTPVCKHGKVTQEIRNQRAGCGRRCAQRRSHCRIFACTTLKRSSSQPGPSRAHIDNLG